MKSISAILLLLFVSFGFSSEVHALKVDTSIEFNVSASEGHDDLIAVKSDENTETAVLMKHYSNEVEIYNVEMFPNKTTACERCHEDAICVSVLFGSSGGIPL